MVTGRTQRGRGCVNAGFAAAHEFRDHCSCGHVRLVGFVRVGGSALELRCQQPPVAELDGQPGAAVRPARTRQGDARSPLLEPASVRSLGGLDPDHRRHAAGSPGPARRSRAGSPVRPFPSTSFRASRPISTAALTDAPGDIKFVVPGSALAPAGTTASFTASFRADLTYQYKTSNQAAPSPRPRASTTSEQDGREEDERAAHSRCPDGQRRQLLQLGVSRLGRRRGRERDADALADLTRSRPASARSAVTPAGSATQSTRRCSNCGPTPYCGTEATSTRSRRSWRSSSSPGTPPTRPRRPTASSARSRARRASAAAAAAPKAWRR